MDSKPSHSLLYDNIAELNVVQISLILLYALDEQDEDGFLSSAFISFQKGKDVDQNILLESLTIALRSAYPDYDSIETTVTDCLTRYGSSILVEDYVYSWYKSYVGLDENCFAAILEYLAEYCYIVLGG